MKDVEIVLGAFANRSVHVESAAPPAQRGALGAEIVVHVTVHVRGKSGSVVSKEYVVRFT